MRLLQPVDFVQDAVRVLLEDLLLLLDVVLVPLVVLLILLDARLLARNLLGRLVQVLAQAAARDDGTRFGG